MCRSTQDGANQGAVAQTTPACDASTRARTDQALPQIATIPASMSHSTTRQTLAGARDLLPLAAAHPQRYPCLLESVACSGAQARFDVLFAFPRDSLTLH